MFVWKHLNIATSFRRACYVQRRFKHKQKHWSQMNKKQLATNNALQHFDDFYGKVFGGEWPSIRIALLSSHKYCAIINNFADTENIISELEIRGAMDMKRLFDVEMERLRAQQPQHEVEHDENIYKVEEETMNKLMQEKQERLAKLNSDADELPPKPMKNVSSLLDKVNDTKSLSASFESAEIDTSRIINPGSGLSSALLHEYVPATKLIGSDDYVYESSHYSLYQDNSDFPVSVKKEFDLQYPPFLKVFTYERGNVTSFPQPKRRSEGVFDYYLLNGSSILPVLALGLQLGDRVLDMCASPGGKSLMMLQTMHPGLLVCNDESQSRLNRIKTVLKDYLHDMKFWENEIHFKAADGRLLMTTDTYDKILLDVPCTTDRHSLMEEENNIFKRYRVKERLQLPHIQSHLLTNALKMVVPGGTVVYSTCTLSPIQNDGVVHMALRNIWEETNINIEVRDLSPALEVTKNMFKFANSSILKYGHLVLPFLPCNYGPLYFCKLVRTS